MKGWRWGIAVLLTLCFIGFGTAGDSVSTRVISDDGRRTVLEFQVLDYHLEPVLINGRPFQVVNLPGEAVNLELGAPALPHISRDLIIPDDAGIQVKILEAKYRDVPAAIAPSKGNLKRTVSPAAVPYSFGLPYRTDAFYPAAVASLGEPYIMRDWRGVTVRIDPFQFNPMQGTLRVYEQVTVEVLAAGTGTKNRLNRQARHFGPVAAFEEIYSGHFLNFGQRKSLFAYPPVDEDGEMLIIAHDPWISNLDPLVSHKQGIGIPVTVVGVSKVGNTAAAIKDYIKNFYQSHNLAFVLLVGDAEQVATPQESDGAADPTYSKITGNDDYPEIIIGRFSAQNAAHVDTQVKRTVDYETLPATSQTWFKRGVGIASDQGGAGNGDEDQSDIVHEDEIRSWLLGDGYTLVDKIYDPGATDTQVSNAVNAGRGIINYTGHGSATSWGTTDFDNNDVNNLANKNQLPFIVSVACNNGEFDNYDTCFAEAWLRATKDGQPTGAVAMYASSISQSWSSPMEGQDEFNKRLTDPARPYKTYGALCFAGSSSMMSAYGSDGVNMFNTWHIFGDPSLRVVGQAAPAHGLQVTPADGLNSTGPIGGPYTPATKTYTLKNLESTPVDFTTVADQPWIQVAPAQGTIAPGGTAEVIVQLNDQAFQLDFGKYQGTVRFQNTSSHDGDTSRTVNLQAGQSLNIRSWDLQTNPGWTTEGQWQFGQPTGQGGLSGRFNPDPTSGATGSNVYGVNLNGNYSGTVSGPFRLTSGPIDLTGIAGSSLRFQRWLNTAGPLYVASKVEVTGDGSTWTTVWNADKPVADAVWSLQTIDISAVADNKPAVQVRWSYEVTKQVNIPGSGWNIDDIQILGGLPTAKTTLNVTREKLSWSAIPGAMGYDLVSGDLGVLLTSGGDFSAATRECLTNDLPGLELPHSAVPAPGQGAWFLVRGVASSEPLTYQELSNSQVGTRDPEIAAAPTHCP